MTLSEIEPIIFRIVARCLKQMRYEMRHKHLGIADISGDIRNQHIPNTCVAVILRNEENCSSGFYKYTKRRIEKLKLF
jgi:hypothetical protein